MRGASLRTVLYDDCVHSVLCHVLWHFHSSLSVISLFLINIMIIYCWYWWLNPATTVACIGRYHDSAHSGHTDRASPHCMTCVWFKMWHWPCVTAVLMYTRVKYSLLSIHCLLNIPLKLACRCYCWSSVWCHVLWSVWCGSCSTWINKCWMWWWCCCWCITIVVIVTCTSMMLVITVIIIIACFFQ